MLRDLRPKLDNYTYTTALYATEDDIAAGITITLVIPAEFTCEPGIYFIGIRPNPGDGKFIFVLAANHYTYG